jgi:Asp-tRNA(Asn)/Glu-tRNA(Gln) amidotransferase A subunit family amidase
MYPNHRAARAREVALRHSSCEADEQSGAIRGGANSGHPGLSGPSEIAPGSPPRRLAMLETAAWPKASAGAQAAFGQARERLAQLGAEIADRRSDPAISAVEDAIDDAVAVTFAIFDWEFRWPLGNYAKRNGLSEGVRRRLASKLPVEDRNPAFNIPASLLGVPAISLPPKAAEGVPILAPPSGPSTAFPDPRFAALPPPHRWPTPRVLPKPTHPLPQGRCHRK